VPSAAMPSKAPTPRVAHELAAVAAIAVVRAEN